MDGTAYGLALGDLLPAVEIAYTLAQRFTKIIRDRKIYAINSWLMPPPVPSLKLQNFAGTRQRDYDVVSATPTLQWSNSQAGL